MCVIDVDQWIRENRTRPETASPAPAEPEPAVVEASLIPDLPPQRRPLPLRDDTPYRKGRG